MSGYPDEYKVPTRNRQYSNQPGGIATPEQVMAREFTPESPVSNHMRMQADALRAEPSVEIEMDYESSNQPEEMPNDAA
jgi:hypothetical protein